MRSLPVNDFSLSDEKIENIAEILANEPSTSQDEFNLAHEDFFKMNKKDFEKCAHLSLVYSLDFLATKDNPLPINISKQMQEDLSFLIKQSDEISKENSFIRLSPSIAHQFLKNQSANYSEEKRDAASQYCWWAIDCDLYPMNHISVTQNTDISAQGINAINGTCGINYWHENTPPSTTDEWCDVILIYNLPSSFNINPTIRWGATHWHTAWLISTVYPTGISAQHFPGNILSYLTLGFSANNQSLIFGSSAYFLASTTQMFIL